ncbi:MAG: guanine permease [Idiomarina sp.]|jgi:AGZA family xanthine/uracil permease-like MFS transporter|uniref:AGZA family xanthine/uracil permease-like MFS transporter n=1 Tax=Idiomarina aquatica TaxID=1327752 RepID=A0A4R6PLL9_9GAMM|nr:MULTISPECIES: NCS2 family permease [Idiomarina]MBL4741547.1 NCS2 family permease [Idiomarina sp.]MBT42366.1 guanine permease [Idiomarina sp.]PHQ77815.1 MAG: guanine permease [Idiomarina sp.]TDP39091.1 AGZA family xanthine/uracil permease-like MFS transporter [Idiomarina aquatica]
MKQSDPSNNLLERLFKINAQGSSVKSEVIGGITTFLTMAYIIFVNPSILSETGMDYGAVFVATCLAAAIGCLIMGLWANYPVALAPGMGLNAFFTYTVVFGMGYTWQTALGAVFFSGIIFFLLSAFRVREWIIKSIPTTLRLAIAAGIGAFLALIGLKNANIIVASDATMVALGDLGDTSVLLAAAGFFLIIGLVARQIQGAALISILLISAIALMLGLVDYEGIVSMPPSLAPTFMQMDIAAAFDLGMLSVIFAFLFVDLFDTSGTLLAVAQRAGIAKADGHMPRLEKALMADSTATVAGSVMGTSTTTSYIESAAGVASGGKTGLAAVTVGILFLLAMFFAPLAGMIPPYATAGAIIYVAVLMLFTLKDVQWEDITEAAPVAVVLLMTPLTYSIADGIALGFISYVVVKFLAGRYRELNPSVVVLGLLFIAKFIWLG